MTIKRIFVIVLILYSSTGFAQPSCNNSFSIKTINSKIGQNNGVIKVQVDGSDSFICQLNIIEGSGVKKLKEVSNKNSNEISFENLTPGSSYQVLVTYSEEKDFLCRRRQISQIIISEE